MPWWRVMLLLGQPWQAPWKRIWTRPSPLDVDELDVAAVGLDGGADQVDHRLHAVTHGAAPEGPASAPGLEVAIAISTSLTIIPARREGQTRRLHVYGVSLLAGEPQVECPGE